jgi:GntR family transcriptional repressor for pyruvate dehydrogenase complex
MITDHIAIRSYARVSAKLKERIASGEFELGTRLPPERELTLFYNVSRPTIREAMIALEIEGIVSVRPGSGNYVISMRSRIGMAPETDVDVLELLQAHRAIESEACAIAASRICPKEIVNLTNIVEEIRRCHLSSDVIGFEYAQRQFHLSIAKASGKAVAAAVDTLWSIRTHVPQYEMLNGKLRTLGHERDFKNYVSVVRALKEGSVQTARAAMKVFYDSLMKCILDEIEYYEVKLVRERIEEKRNLFL